MTVTLDRFSEEILHILYCLKLNRKCYKFNFILTRSYNRLDKFYAYESKEGGKFRKIYRHGHPNQDPPKKLIG